MRFLQKIPAKKPRRKVMIGLGAGDGSLEAPCVASLYAAAPLLWAADISVELCIEAGNCHVDDMRNAIVAQFMQGECDTLVFIDADVNFQAEDLLRLIEHDRDIVGGVYPRKQDDESFPVFVKGGTDLYADEAGLVEVHGLPTGFLKIRRNVIEELWAESVAWIGSDEVEYRELFARGFYDGARKSGDYAFCCKWLARGGQVFADPVITLGHTGKKTWAGNLGDHWKRVHGVASQERSQAFVKAVYSAKSGEPDFEALRDGWGNTEWIASQDLLSTLWDAVGPKDRVLECGSGLSTLVLALAGADVTVLEHDPAFASHTQGMLDQFGLKAEIICRPLRDGWYDYEGGEFDVLLIDGPPREISNRAIALERVKAPVVIWDDYEGGLDDPEVTEGEKRLAVARA